jgi:hypothetical protein
LFAAPAGRMNLFAGAGAALLSARARLVRNRRVVKRKDILAGIVCSVGYEN